MIHYIRGKYRFENLRQNTDKSYRSIARMFRMIFWTVSVQTPSMCAAAYQNLLNLQFSPQNCWFRNMGVMNTILEKISIQIVTGVIYCLNPQVLRQSRLTIYMKIFLLIKPLKINIFCVLVPSWWERTVVQVGCS